MLILIIDDKNRSKPRGFDRGKFLLVSSLAMLNLNDKYSMHDAYSGPLPITIFPHQSPIALFSLPW